MITFPGIWSILQTDLLKDMLLVCILVRISPELDYRVHEVSFLNRYEIRHATRKSNGKWKSRNLSGSSASKSLVVGPIMSTQSLQLRSFYLWLKGRTRTPTFTLIKYITLLIFKILSSWIHIININITQTISFTPSSNI